MKTSKHLQLALAVLLSTAVFSAHAGQTSYFIYDESGHVIGEYDANGNPVQEHIYVDDRPVAVAVTTNNTTTLDYVTTDQLDTPRDITDGSGAVIWSWNSDPYGNGQPTGSIIYNLRFPGQYYDAETGHNYNYFRDYDPTTGRYVESDPIGLLGGINTYTYVGGNPIRLIDPWGLAPPVLPVPVPFGTTNQDFQATNTVQNAYNESPAWRAQQPNGPSQCGSACLQIDQGLELWMSVPGYISDGEELLTLLLKPSLEQLGQVGLSALEEAADNAAQLGPEKLQHCVATHVNKGQQ